MLLCDHAIFSPEELCDFTGLKIEIENIKPACIVTVLFLMN